LCPHYVSTTSWMVIAPFLPFPLGFEPKPVFGIIVDVRESRWPTVILTYIVISLGDTEVVHFFVVKKKLLWTWFSEKIRTRNKNLHWKSDYRRTYILTKFSHQYNIGMVSKSMDKYSVLSIQWFFQRVLNLNPRFMILYWNISDFSKMAQICERPMSRIIWCRGYLVRWQGLHDSKS